MGTSAWTRQLADKLTGIVRGFADTAGALTLSQLATSAGVPTSTAERLAAQFISWGLLTRDPAGNYLPGVLIRLHLRSTAPLDDSADVLASLVRTGERTARLGAAHPTGVTYVERRTGTAPTAFSSVGTVSQRESALGQALLARDGVTVSSDTRMSDRSGDRTLALTRLTGLAVVRYREAVTGVAVPVHGPDGSPVVALELIVRGRSDVEVAIGEVTAAAQSLAGRLPAADSLHTRRPYDVN